MRLNFAWETPEVSRLPTCWRVLGGDDLHRAVCPFTAMFTWARRM